MLIFEGGFLAWFKMFMAWVSKWVIVIYIYCKEQNSQQYNIYKYIGFSSFIFHDFNSAFSLSSCFLLLQSVKTKVLQLTQNQ